MSPSRPSACPDLPTFDRSTDGSTRAYLGCDLRSGPIITEAFTGGPRRSLGEAIDHVLEDRLGPNDEATIVTITGRFATVTLPDAVRSLDLQKADAAEFGRALTFTAFSNGSVDSVRFTIAGDCLAYALATGGGVCSVVSLTRIAGLR